MQEEFWRGRQRPMFGAGDVGDAPGIPGFESRPGKKPNTQDLFELEADDKLYGIDNVTGKKQFPLYPLTTEFKQEKARSTGGLWNMAKASPVGTFFSGLQEATITPVTEWTKLLEWNFDPDQINKLTQASPQMGGLPSPYQQDFFTKIVQNPTTPYDEFAEAGLYEINNYGSKEHLYKERIDKIEKERGRSLAYNEKRDIYMNDFMETPHIAVETAAITLEMLVPATATEVLVGKGIVGGAKFLGKPAAKVINKGKKKILEGWGELIDNFKPEHVEELHSRATPISDLTDDELWKVSTNFKVIDEYFDDQLGYLARGAEGDSIHTPTLEEIAGKPRDEWSATDIDDLQAVLREGQQKERLYFDEVIEEALNRDRLGTITVLGASTGKPMNGLFFTGSGRQSVQEIANKGAELTEILGDAVYAKTTKTSAATYGPNIDVVDVHINNPLVITSDKHWEELVKQADIENFVPGDIEEVEKLRRFIFDSGYDGVVIRPRDSIYSPKLLNTFGVDETIVKFGEAAKNPAKFNEIFGYIPDEGTISVARLLKLVQADNQFSRNELVNMLDELVESGEVIRNPDGSFSKGVAGKATEADIPVSRSTEDIYEMGLDAIDAGDATTPHPLVRVPGERHPDFHRLPLAKGPPRNETLDEAIARITNHAVGYAGTPSKTLSKETDEFRKWSEDIRGLHGEELQDDAIERFNNRGNQLEDNYGFDPDLAQTKNLSRDLNAIADEFMRLSEESADTLKRREERVQQWIDQLLENEQAIMEAGMEAVERDAASRVPIDGNPPGVPAEIARAADEHPVNRTGATEPTYTTKKTTEEPDPNRMNPPPNYDEPVSRMWHTKGNRETMAERRDRFIIRFNELVNDTYWGVRHLQTLLEKAKSARPTKERDNLIKQYKQTRLALESPKLAEKDRAALAKKLDSLDKKIDDTAPEPGMSVEELQRDLNFIQEVTLAPGAVNAGITRAQMVINEILRISKNIMPDDLNSLLFLRRAEDLIKLDKNHVFPIDPATGKAIQYQDLVNQVASMESRMTQKEIEDLWKAADEVIKFYAAERDRLVARGLISKELAAYFAKHHPNYNPMRYIQEGMQNPTWKAGGYKPFTNRNNTLIKNSEADFKGWAPNRPLDLMFETAIRNEAIGTRNDLARIMVKLQLEWESLPGTEKITKRVAIGKGENVIEFFENGRHHRYEVPAWMKREADYMTSTFAGPVDWLVGSVNGISRAAFTTVSPVFIPVNAFADGLTALHTQGLLPHRTLMELARSMKGLKEDNVALSHKLTGAYQQRFFGSTGKNLAEGMGINTQMSEDQIAKALEKKVGGKWIYEGKPIGQKSMLKMFDDVVRSGFGLSTIGEATEQAPRRALFKRELDKALGKGWENKWTPEEIAQMPVARKAAADSVEVTLNFARGGLIPKIINPWVIFFNAGVEGFKLPYRVLRDKPKSRAILLGMMGGQMGITAYNMQYPEYYDVPSEKRWGGGIIMLPSKKKKPNGAPEAHYIEAVPYRQLSLFLGGTTYIMEKLHRESPQAWTDFLIATGQNSTPLFQMPTIPLIEEVGEQWGNYDLFRQQPIIPPEIAGEPAAKQVMPWTSRTMKEIGESINASPVRLDHAGIGLLGGTFKWATSITDAIIEMIDPEKVTPETARIFAEYEAIDDYQKKKDYYAKLNPEQRKNLDFELGKPEPYTRWAGLGPIADRFYSTGGSGISQSAQKEAERVTGISPQDTRSVYAKMYDLNDKHLTEQQGIDADLLSGAINGTQWRKGRSQLGVEYQAVLENEAGRFPKSAQAANPEDRQKYYDTITKWTKNAPDEYNRTKMLSSAWYAITLQEPTPQTLESGPTQTLIPDAKQWEDFRMRQKEFLDSLSPEDRILLENEITAGYTPIEKIYYEDSKFISEYFDYATAQLKTDLNKAQVLEKVEKQGIGSLSIAEVLVMHDQLDQGLRDYENYKNGDPNFRKGLYPNGAAISNMMGIALQAYRRNNYDVDKSLLKWELTTRPQNVALQDEYMELLDKLGEDELKIPLLLDDRIFQAQQTETVAP